ncbi:MAG TPA: sulfatase-like hydrolase/transferase [Pseudorhodoplanes sp.]|nr:sulfatase-like hydrolase/transferase [Pseudorhodoplanes sp.]
MSLADYLPRVEESAASLTPRSRRIRLLFILALHAIALVAMVRTEVGPNALSIFLLTWALLNFFWLTVLGRPAIAALISLVVVETIIQLSYFKFEITWMTITFLDLLIVDTDTFKFLLAVSPSLRLGLFIGAIAAIPLLVLIWKGDPFRLRRRASAAGAAGCMTIIAVLSLAVPEQPTDPFQGVNHVSSFVRSGVTAMLQLSTSGWIESDPDLAGHLKSTANDACILAKKPPHIVLVLDESSFDVTAAPGIKVPENYRDHFKSLDGRIRRLAVESTGGPTWYTEYNVLTGLSAKSFGKLMFYVTRIAADHVRRGLPQALRHCGYQTFSLYPAYGAFLNARRFQASAGVQKLYDQGEMGANDVEPDSFYYDQAIKIIARERKKGPLFTFVYTVANHFPWDETYKPDLTPGWIPLGNTPEIDEYIRRQVMSAKDYRDFRERLAREFPDDEFLIVRFGDHQPYISSKFIEPGRPLSEIAHHIMQGDLRYFTTYYAIDGVNYRPADLSDALGLLDAPYLPLVVLEAAGLPLDATFAEQKTVMRRCSGLFFRCKNGAEARRFNRLLIDADLIKGL